MSTAVVVAVTAAAVAVKLAAVLPAATVTELGVVTDELLSEIVTTAPPVGAAPDSATVQVVLPAPVIDVGEQLNEDNVTVTTAGDKVKLAEAVLLLYVATSVAVVLVVTAATAAVKLVVVLPAATVTDVGAVTHELLLEMVTVAPPVGAAPVNLTVQVDVPAPVIELGEQLKDDSVVAVVPDGDSVTLAVTLLPLYVAVTVTAVAVVTASAVAIKAPVVDPAMIVRDADVSSDELLDEVLIVAPPVGASPVNVTVQVDVPAPVIAVGEQLKDDTVTVPPVLAGDSVRLAVALLPL